LIAFGSALDTSARPPVFANGSTSLETKRIFNGLDMSSVKKWEKQSKFINFLTELQPESHEPLSCTTQITHTSRENGNLDSLLIVAYFERNTELHLPRILSYVAKGSFLIKQE
jgi:hypothetical protein